MADPLSGAPMPDRAALHEAALRHLSRYAATEAGLLRVLRRRVERWARASGAEAEEAMPALQAAAEVVRALTAAGAVNDAAFAAARARRLLRSGKSGRAVAAHLQARGVAAGLLDDVRPAPDAELSAALAFARRRRFGPFRAGPGDGDTARRELGAMARAGFPRTVAEQALAMTADAAEPLLRALRGA